MVVFPASPGAASFLRIWPVKDFAISLLLLTVLTGLTGCATSDPTRIPARTLDSDSYATLYLGANGQIVTRQTQAGKAQAKGYWNGNGMTGSPSIVINLSKQEAFFYKGGQLAGMSPISSGREGYHSPTGRFSVIQKDATHRSTLYGDYVDSAGNVVVRNVGIMEDPRPPGTSFRGASMPYFLRVHNGVGMHEGFLPGVPDSHGCIRLPGDMAKIFYENVSVGTPVTITH